jgi:hypothetical protein
MNPFPLYHETAQKVFFWLLAGFTLQEVPISERCSKTLDAFSISFDQV